VEPPGARPLEIIVSNDNNSNPSPDDRTRFYLAIIVAALVVVLALITVVQPTASAVLDKMLPLLTMVLGFFFGQQVQRARS
jgi:hypothetical protein